MGVDVQRRRRRQGSGQGHRQGQGQDFRGLPSSRPTHLQSMRNRVAVSSNCHGGWPLDSPGAGAPAASANRCGQWPRNLAERRDHRLAFAGAPAARPARVNLPRHAPWVLAMSIAAAGCGAAQKPPGDLGADAGPGEAEPGTGSGAIPSCAAIDDAAQVVVATAAGADEYGLVLTAQSQSATRWSTAGDEALVLEVSGGGGRLIGHLVLHQGAAAFDYGMQLGA